MSSLRSGSQSKISSQTETTPQQVQASAKRMSNHLVGETSATVTYDISSDKPPKIVKYANPAPSSPATQTSDNKSCGLLSPPQLETDWDRCKPAETLAAIDSDKSNSRNFGRKVGWRPTPDITQKWNAQIHPRVLQIVQDPDNHEFIIRKGGECQAPCAYHLWMVSGQPTIVIMCANKKIAKATKVVLKNNPLFRDQHSEFALLPWTEADFELLTGTPTHDSQSRASLSLCGKRVIATSIPIDEEAPWNQATIGGILKLRGSYFGVTVAHPFFCGATRQTRSLHQGLMAERDRREAEKEGSRLEKILEEDKLENDLEESELEKDYEEFKAIKIKVKSPFTKLSSTSPPEDKSLASVVFQSRPSRFGTVTGTKNDPNTLINLNAPDFLENLALVGYLPGSGRTVGAIFPGDHFLNMNQYVSRDLDWALIRIVDPRYWVPNKFTGLSGSVFCPTNVAYSPPTGRVLITSQWNGPRETYCTGLRSSILIPGATAMQEVWSIETSCFAGDCGAWVLDLFNGDLIGILIASTHKLNIAYIMPAWNIFRDIDSKWTGGIGRPSDLLSESPVLHRPPDSTTDLPDNISNVKIESDVLDRPTAAARDADELASSIISLLELTFVVSNLCYGYIHSAENASKTIERILAEVHSLGGALSGLEYLSKHTKDLRLPILELLGTKDGLLDRCKQVLEELERRLTSASGRLQKLGTMTLPFVETKISDLLIVMERHKSIFILALTGDHTKISIEIQKEVAEWHQSFPSAQADDEEARILHWPLDYTLHIGKKSTSEEQKTHSASELGTEEIPISTDIERKSIPVQVDSPAPDRVHKTSPTTPPPQKRQKTKGKAEVVYYCCSCEFGPFNWEKFQYCPNCYRRQCARCRKENLKKNFS